MTEFATNPKYNRIRCLLPLLLSALCVAIRLCFTPLVHDDLEAYHDFAKSSSIAELWKYTYERFFTWSSRTLIEFVLMIFEKVPKPVWAFAMGLTWFVLLWAISEFFLRKSFKGYLFLAVVALLIPFDIFESAGWIATTHTYLTPIALGVLSLLPVRGVFDEELQARDNAVTPLKCVGYSLAIIYAANLEQIAVVLIFIYGAALLVELYSRKVSLFHVWLLLLSVLSLLVALVCPGNAARSWSNTTYWFPSYVMLSFGDKLELGFTTELKWLLREVNLFWYVIAIVIFVSVLKRQKDRLYRIIGAMPMLITLFFFISVTAEKVLPDWWLGLMVKVPRNGMISVGNAFSASSFVQWMLFGLFYVSLVLSVWLASANTKIALFREILLFGGFGSKWMMGFSPTVYASGDRTCLVLIFMLILIGASLFDDLIE